MSLQRLAFSLLAAAPLFAADSAEFFEKNIRPVLVAKCQACHGAKVQMAGITFSTADGFAKAQPKLLDAISYAGKIKMPPGGKLADDQIEKFQQWFADGAVWPATLASSASAQQQTHWAFQPVKKDIRPPVTSNRSWVRTPVDAFILAKLEEKKLQPADPASRLTLLRRVTYDLTGLPPTLDEIRAFENDHSTNAFAKVVDRLLASPHYGERWGRHWLDVARFADSTGMDEDHVYPDAWRYRDYVVRAFNQDLPYDDFVREQIAGDLIRRDHPERRAEGILATGFLALGPKPLAQQDRVKMIYDVVDEQIEATSKAFLGITVACARCHDHKFDPIPTKDYYGLAGIFASTTSFRALGKPGSVSYINYVPLDPNADARYQAHRWRMYAKQIELEEAMSEDYVRNLASWDAVKIEAALKEAAKTKQGPWQAWLDKQSASPAELAARWHKAATAWDKTLQNWRRRFADEVASDREVPPRPMVPSPENPFWPGGPLEAQESPRVAVLRAEYELLKSTLPPAPEVASAVTDGYAVHQKVFPRGNHLSPGEPVAPHFPTALGGVDKPAIPPASSGRRELAEWMASPANPITARVIVNRVWQWHFGEGLMRTPNNWGTMGDRPSHPELLDYLAHWFVTEGKWSIKALHRQIVLSSTYQQATGPAPEQDPPNRLLSRFPRVRMSVEQLRDSFLVFDGTLDRTIGGMVKAGKKGAPETDAFRRRTLYLQVRRGSVPVLLSTFDYGDATTVSDGRARTNVAPQALFIMNSEFVVERARNFSKLLLATTESDAERIQKAYLTALTRRATPAEVDEALSYIAAFTQKTTKEQAWQSYCHVLMSTNEFLYLN